MIEELHIRGLGVLDDVTLRLAPGLTVVTGETGAGKTLLVTALGLLLGGRGASDLVRAGEDAALVEAVVAAPPAPADVEVEDAAAALWAQAEDGVLTVAREVPREGRARVRVAGRLATVGTLSELLGPHVEVHGQDEHRRIERPAVQRRLLDRTAGPAHATALSAYAAAHAAWQEVRRRRGLLATDARERTRRIDALRAERDAIEALAIDPERDDRIDADLERLMHADELRTALGSAAAGVGADGAGEVLGRAAAALRRLPMSDPELAGLVERVAGLVRDASDLAADLASLASDVEADPVRLEQLQLRKRDLTGLLRRFGPTPSDVLAHLASVRSELADLEALEGDADGLEAAEAEALAEVHRAGAAVTRGRTAAAADLATQVGSHLADLGLPHAAFHVDVGPAAEPGPDGLDEVTFLLAANPGEPAVRLGSGASGGERSRVALALEVALAEVDDAAVLVFDEVDAGVGGTTALAVGAKLARLAATGPRPRQVLCVTHLAQVAAFADVHHVVEKVVRGDRTVTVVREVADDARAEELSRMLGGAVTAGKGLEHAAGLLAAAREQRASSGAV